LGRNAKVEEEEFMGNFFTDVIEKDARFHSVNRIADPALLEPVTRAAVQAVIADASTRGIKLMIFETFRSQERQQVLFEQGATQLRTVGVHNYGLACDLVKDINGDPSWKGDFSFLGVIGPVHGLVWGGDWGRPDLPHSFRDNDHVQRCSLAMQPQLFRGEFYPDPNYDPFMTPIMAAKPASAGS
jgi:D-alanyl-D-alanine carboxypeptidase